MPVDRGDGQVEWVRWGKRSEENLPGFLNGGWARQKTIESGWWDKYQPEFVSLAVQAFMEKEGNPTTDPEHPNRKPTRKSHWFDIEPGKAIEALIAHVEGDKRLYVVTVPTPAEYAWLEHDRWPKIV
ncbi:MAG TPA: hypothetical protein VK954_11435 [Methyloradius sp.]|nr:hypothetical protein [Methyloradius sp.]